MYHLGCVLAGSALINPCKVLRVVGPQCSPYCTIALEPTSKCDLPDLVSSLNPSSCLNLCKDVPASQWQFSSMFDIYIGRGSVMNNSQGNEECAPHAQNETHQMDDEEVLPYRNRVSLEGATSCGGRASCFSISSITPRPPVWMQT